MTTFSVKITNATVEFNIEAKDAESALDMVRSNFNEINKSQPYEKMTIPAWAKLPHYGSVVTVNKETGRISMRSLIDGNKLFPEILENFKVSKEYERGEKMFKLTLIGMLIGFGAFFTGAFMQSVLVLSTGIVGIIILAFCGFSPFFRAVEQYSLRKSMYDAMIEKQKKEQAEAKNKRITY